MSSSFQAAARVSGCPGSLLGQRVRKQQYGGQDQRAHRYRCQRIEQHLQYASHLLLLNRHENEPAVQIGPASRRQHVDDSVAVAGRVGLDDRPGLSAEVPPVNDGLDRYREGRAGLFRNSHGHPAVNTRGDFKRAAHRGIIYRQLPRFQQFPDSAGVLAECLSVGPQVVSCELGCGATITAL